MKIYASKNDKVIAAVVGTYDPEFYAKFLYKGDFGEFRSWNKDFPNWKEKPLLILQYIEKTRNMTKAEVAFNFDLTEEQVSDKLYEALTSEYTTMVVPYDSVKLIEGDDENKNSN